MCGLRAYNRAPPLKRTAELARVQSRAPIEAVRRCECRLHGAGGLRAYNRAPPLKRFPFFREPIEVVGLRAYNRAPPLKLVGLREHRPARRGACARTIARPH